MNFVIYIKDMKRKWLVKRKKIYMKNRVSSKIIGRSFIKVSNQNLIKLLCFFLVAFVFVYIFYKFGFFVSKGNLILDLASSDPILVKENSNHASEIASQSNFVSNKKLIKQFLVFASLTVGSFVFVKIAVAGSATAIVATSIGVSSSLSAIATGWVLGSNLLFPETTSVVIAEKDVCTSVVTSVVTGVSIAAGATPTEAAETAAVITSILDSDVVSEKSKLDSPIAGASVAKVVEESVPEKTASTTLATSVATGTIAAVVTGVSIAAGATPTEAAAIGGASGVIAYKAITSGGFNYSRENWGRSILSSIITGAACGLAMNSIMKVITSAGSSPVAPVIIDSPPMAPAFISNMPSASAILQSYKSTNLTIPDMNSFIKDEGRFYVVESLVREGLAGGMETGIIEELGEPRLRIKQYIFNVIDEVTNCANSSKDAVACVDLASEVTQLEDEDLIVSIKYVIVYSNSLFELATNVNNSLTPLTIESYNKLNWIDSDIKGYPAYHSFWDFVENTTKLSGFKEGWHEETAIEIKVLEGSVKRLEQEVLLKASSLGIVIKPVEPEPVDLINQTYARLNFDKVNESIAKSRNIITACKKTIRIAVEAIKAKERAEWEALRAKERAEWEALRAKERAEREAALKAKALETLKYGCAVAIIVTFTFVGGMAKAGLLV